MSLSVSRLSARAGTFRLDDVTFEVPARHYGVVIGPAGAGKTTLLECVAGVHRATAGSVAVNGRELAAVPPEHRGIGIVYQHAYLFPHLSVKRNVAYAAPPAIVDDMLARFGIAQLAERPVGALSGGERQLVALARALAPAPEVLLLDEPFAALDPRTRAMARRAVRALHRERGTTILHVTHDFAEAGMLGDVAVLLEQGRVLQVGPPAELFRRPASAFAADFLGAENVLAGSARSRDGMTEIAVGTLVIHAVGDAQGNVHAVIRADDIVLSTTSPEGSSMRNQFAGTVADLTDAGVLTHVTVDVGGTSFVSAVTTRSATDLGLAEGARVAVSFKATAVHIC
jgi:molybdopterin-binding protein